MPKARTRLRNGGFDAFSQRVLLGKGWRLLSTTSCLKCFMLGLRSYRDGSPLVLLLRAGTVSQLRADATICGGEFDLDDLVFPVIDGRSPTDTALSLGTNRLLMVPID